MRPGFLSRRLQRVVEVVPYDQVVLSAELFGRLIHFGLGRFQKVG